MLKHIKRGVLQFLSDRFFFSRYIHFENAEAHRELKQRTLKVQTLLYACEINLIESQCISIVFYSETNVFAFVT